MSAGASYERIENDAGAAQGFLYAAATLNVTPHVLIAGALGYVEDTAAVQPVTGTGYHVGVFYMPLRTVRLHALYSHLDARAGPSRRNVALGLALPFSLKH